MSKKTKKNKSNYRLQQTVKQSQTWKELDGIYNGISTAIITIASGFNSCIANIVALDKDKNKELVPIVKSFDRDINMFIDQLKDIKQKHINKHGFVVNGDELVEMLVIANEYTVLFEKFKTITNPIMLMVSQEFEETYYKIKQQQEEVAEILEDKTELN